VQCFQKDPEGLALNIAERFKGRILEGGDVVVEVTTFPEIFVRVFYWKGDEDLPPEVTMLFDRGLMRIYCTEDVAVLLMLVVKKICKIHSYADIFG
jgi:hypothetical protein